MENYLENYEKLCYKNIITLTSIIEIKSSELITINQTKINNFDLWLSDSNLILIENIKKNNPNVDLPSDYNRSQMHSPINSKRENSFANSCRIFNRNEIAYDTINASDLLIANFVKNLNRDFIRFKNTNIANNSANTENQLFNNSFGFKTLDEDRNNLNNKELPNNYFSEKITENMKDIQVNLNIKNRDLSFKGELSQCNPKNKRRRDSEDLENLLKEEFPSKQIKFENESFEYKAKDIKEFKSQTQNLNSEIIQSKKELSNQMDIENENPSAKFSNENVHFSNSFTNNNNHFQNRNANAENNNYLNQSTNSNVIMEQPSKEQDLSFTPQNSNRFISFNCLDNNLNNNELNNEDKRYHGLSNNFFEQNVNSKPFSLMNNLQNNFTNNAQLGKLNENTPLYSKVLDKNFQNPSTVNFTFNKKNDSNPNLIQNNENFIPAEATNYIEKLKNTNKISLNSFVSFENKNVISIDKSEYTFRNKDNKNADLNFNSISNQDVNNKIPISNDTIDKNKQKKASDGIKRFTLSKNYLEDNVQNEEQKISSLNKILPESADVNLKNNSNIPNEDKMDIVYSDKYLESETVKSDKNHENLYISTKNKFKNQIVNSDSNIKNGKKHLNNKNKSNKENVNKTQSKSQNKNKENVVLNQEEKLNNEIKGQLLNNNLSNYNDNFQSKKALNRIELNNNSNNVKKENQLNALINKNFTSKELKKTFEQSNKLNKDKINLDIQENKYIDSKKVSNFKVDNNYLLGDKDKKAANFESLYINHNLNLKEGKKPDLIDLKIKKILNISSYDESQSNFSHSEREKDTIISSKNKNNHLNKSNNLAKGVLNIQIPITVNDYQEKINNKNTETLSNNNLENQRKEEIINNITQINPNNQSNEADRILHNTQYKEKEESDIQLEVKFITHDFQKSRIIEMGNNLIKDMCVYELTDETPNSSDMEDTDDYLDFLNQKKKKTNPEWALDKTYIKKKIVEQNNLKQNEEVFGKREKIEYLDLKNIFSTAGSEFDIRGESADWKMDNTISSRRYNRQSRIDKIEEEVNDNNEEVHMFSNFKKTSRNLYNDFQP